MSTKKKVKREAVKEEGDITIELDPPERQRLTNEYAKIKHKVGLSLWVFFSYLYFHWDN